MADFLFYEQQGGAVTLTMNRPQERNPLSDEGQLGQFVAACARIRADLSVKRVILAVRPSMTPLFARSRTGGAARFDPHFT